MERNEIYRRVDHTLLANPGVQLADIRQVVSHDQGIRQCSEWLKQHPEIQVTTMANTAAAAQFVAQSGRRDVAAISSRTCASSAQPQAKVSRMAESTSAGTV